MSRSQVGWESQGGSRSGSWSRSSARVRIGFGQGWRFTSQGLDARSGSSEENLARSCAQAGACVTQWGDQRCDQRAKVG